MLLLVLGWEVLRQNIGSDKWPWTIALLGIAPAAALAGAFASLLIAREQFARSMRPSLSWSSQFQKNDDLDDSAWTVHLMNFGPALAHLESVKYSLTVVTQLGVIQKKDVSRREAMEVLNRLGLQEGRDYFLMLITPGLPLPVVKQRTEGFEFAAFKVEALSSIQKLDFRVRVIDMMGDHHEKSLPFMATLPDNLKQVSRHILPNQPAIAQLTPNLSGKHNDKRTRHQRTNHGKRGSRQSDSR
jgi:hypothetical protein